MTSLLERLKRLRDEGKQIDWRAREAAEDELRRALFFHRDEIIALIGAVGKVRPPSHTAHFDPTGGHGTGCPECQAESVIYREIADCRRPFLMDRGGESEEKK